MTPADTLASMDLARDVLPWLALGVAGWTVVAVLVSRMRERQAYKRGLRDMDKMRIAAMDAVDERNREMHRVVDGLDAANRAGFDSLSAYHEARNDQNQERLP